MSPINLVGARFTNQADRNLSPGGWFLPADAFVNQQAGDDLIAATGGVFGTLEGLLNEGTIIGGAGNDTISATSAGVFTFFGLFGVGLFNLGWIDGGAGNDVVYGYEQNLNDATGIINFVGGTIAGGAGDDSILGEVIGVLGIGLDNFGLLEGGPGRDRIAGTVSGSGYGLINSGSIHGDTGDDIFLFKAGDASESMGPSYGLENESTADINGDEGLDTILGIAGWNGYGISNYGSIRGGQGSDVICGSAEGKGHGMDNFGLIAGDQDNDTIIGRADAGGIGIFNEGTISGGTGNDVVDALVGGFAGEGKTDLGAGNDSLKGFGTGTFIGGAGRDSILLGVGIYAVSATQGTITQGVTVMRIAEFEAIGGVNGGLFFLRDGQLEVSATGVASFT